MPWQKEFTLEKRRKGVFLVTEEVLKNIDSGIKDVKVRPSSQTHAHEQLEPTMAILHR